MYQFSFLHAFIKNSIYHLILACVFCLSITAQTQPNILLIISDDLGVDATNGYHELATPLDTPNLDSLMNNGLTFENVWSAPVCTPTRATIMSGKYGINTGVLRAPGELDTSHESIFKAVEAETNSAYAGAVVGKWHIEDGGNLNHPAEHGIPYYSGVYDFAVADYFNWTQTENGVNTIETDYASTVLTNKGIDWINNESEPWLMWLAHIAPHGPFHTPPDSMYTIDDTGNNYRSYIAMIESMDFEIGRLLDSIPQTVLDNTIIIYVADNGSSNTVLRDYPNGQSKGTLYQGGIRVPMIVSGYGVTRAGERESALIHTSDIYATILELVGADLPGGIYNSHSFKHLLDNTSGTTRPYNYSELTDNSFEGWTIRNAQYKLIEEANGSQEMYDLLTDSLEFNDLLLGTLTTAQSTAKAELEAEALQIRTTGWSCNDNIQNGDETDIDCGGTHCTPCTTEVDVLLENDCLQILPNPTDDIFEIQGLISSYTIEIVDSNGQIYETLTSTSDTININISSYPTGIYFIRMTNNVNSSIQVEKILKTN